MWDSGIKISYKASVHHQNEKSVQPNHVLVQPTKKIGSGKGSLEPCV